MKKIIINDIDLNNSLFHFDVREPIFIEKYGFPPTIGQDSKNAETTPKVFFSKGSKGILDIIDVWIIWRMNKEYFRLDNWSEEFLSGKYLHDENKKTKVFDIMYNWLSERKYYKVDLTEGIDYLENDIDEAKKSIKSENKNSLRYLYFWEMYKGKIQYENELMEPWNMHTISGKGIEPSKISMLITDDGYEDALSIIRYVYKSYPNKEEFRILNEFMAYCQLENIQNNI